MEVALLIKTIEKALLTSLILAILLVITGFWGRCQSISGKVFRLHILANSNSEEDQGLKLKVRDKILEYAEKKLDFGEDKNSAKRAAASHLEEIKQVAEAEIHNQGYDYEVKLELTKMFFDTRIYSKFTLPSGSYDALRISIGEANGKNWWCVMFPTLCLPAAKAKQPIEDILNASEIKIIEGAEKYEARFKIVEILEKIRHLWGSN
jgi:stage II sporulation protein R